MFLLFREGLSQKLTVQISPGNSTQEGTGSSGGRESVEGEDARREGRGPRRAEPGLNPEGGRAKGRGGSPGVELGRVGGR